MIVLDFTFFCSSLAAKARHDSLGKILKEKLYQNTRFFKYECDCITELEIKTNKTEHVLSYASAAPTISMVSVKL